jgi:hypothetical protein
MRRRVWEDEPHSVDDNDPPGQVGDRTNKQVTTLGRGSPVRRIRLAPSRRLQIPTSPIQWRVSPIRLAY